MRYLAKMVVLHLAASKDGGQELKSHLMLAIFYLATPIGLLRKDPVPLDLGPRIRAFPDRRSHSGLSFTAGVAPQAWAQGFRLEEHARELYDALVDGLPPNYAGPLEFPMKTVAHCCRQILLRLAGGARWQDVMAAENLRRMVDESGHRQLLALVTATAHLAKRSARVRA